MNPNNKVFLGKVTSLMLDERISLGITEFSHKYSGNPGNFNLGHNNIRKMLLAACLNGDIPHEVGTRGNTNSPAYYLLCGRDQGMPAKKTRDMPRSVLPIGYLIKNC